MLGAGEIDAGRNPVAWEMVGIFLNWEKLKFHEREATTSSRIVLSETKPKACAILLRFRSVNWCLIFVILDKETPFEFSL